jgi:CP family cyanate transporter-like MFS transporter
MKISNKYMVESIIFISYVLFAMAWVGGTASMQQIMSEMKISSLASASFISGAVTLAKIFGTFVSAWVAIKVGIKYAFFVAGLLISIGIFTPLVNNYELLLICRFLMGIGGAFMVVYFNPIVMKFFSVNERSTINGINAVAFNVGTAIIMWTMADINLITGSWKTSLILFSLGSLLLSIVWLFVQYKTVNDPEKNDDTSTTQPVEHYTYAQGFKDSFNWIYALGYSGLLALYICLFTFYPKAGISQSKWVIGFGILGTFAGILYSKQFVKRIPVIRFSSFFIPLMIFGLSFSGNAMLQTLFAMILGFFAFFPVTALVSIPHELPKMTIQRMTVIFSLFYSISYSFATIVLWAFGKLVDMNNGDYTASFLLIFLVSWSLFVGSFFLPETQRNS